MFLDEFIDDHYQKLGLDFRANFKAGQICKAPVLYAYENAEVWRPCRYDSSQTHATEFNLISRPGDAYKQARTLHTPRLEAYEEFPVIRAKCRPVILLVPDPPDVGIRSLQGGGKMNRHLCVVAACYSVSDAMGKLKYPQAFIDRVRLLEFPQFMFLPASACTSKDSLLRLDSIQHVFHNELEATQWALAEDIRKILCGQLNYVFSGVYDGEYKVARDMLLTQN